MLLFYKSIFFVYMREQAIQVIRKDNSGYFKDN